MVTPAGQFISALANQHRVLVIGGLAVIAHGFNRPTKDADIWLDPLDSPTTWAGVLERICAGFPGLSIHTLPGWRPVAGPEISQAAEEIGMVRILGLDCPVDIFRRPNEFPSDSFDEVFERGTPNTDGTRLPDPLDLIITKLNTWRDKDLDDSRHLESVIRKRYQTILPSASLDEVRKLFDRFLDWEVCRIALENPSQDVRNYTIECLREMAGEGDPFSQALLEDHKIPYSGG
ncbi:MAG: hypothetical protein WCS43_04140 [Verrucomicrobiota bacterium]